MATRVKREHKSFFLGPLGQVVTHIHIQIRVGVVDGKVLLLAGHIIDHVPTGVEFRSVEGADEKVVGEFVVVKDLFHVNEELLAPEDHVVVDLNVGNVAQEHAEASAVVH